MSRGDPGGGVGRHGHCGWKGWKHSLHSAQKSPKKERGRGHRADSVAGACAKRTPSRSWMPCALWSRDSHSARSRRRAVPCADSGDTHPHGRGCCVGRFMKPLFAPTLTDAPLTGAMEGDSQETKSKGTGGWARARLPALRRSAGGGWPQTLGKGSAPRLIGWDCQKSTSLENLVP